jgi:hypothetical protein
MIEAMLLTGCAPVADLPPDLDAAHVAAMVQAAQLVRVASFLAATADVSDASLVLVIFLATEKGWGKWTPATPATREVVIDLFGVTATGPDNTTAAANWRRAARNLTGSETPE